jgi:Mg-chelatase subunit ChlD
METTHQVHNLIILDESGSMQSIKGIVMNGFNELVQTVKGIAIQFPEQAHYISFVSFNGLGQKVHLLNEPVEKIELIDEANYIPDASTPLYDAIGFSIAKLKAITSPLENCNVLVTIMTDGEENASKEFGGNAIKAMIEELKLANWTFTYIGTDHDVTAFAHNLSIDNSKLYSKDTASMRMMFEQEQSARVSYSLKIRNNESTETGFYATDKDKK